MFVFDLKLTYRILYLSIWKASTVQNKKKKLEEETDFLRRCWRGDISSKKGDPVSKIQTCQNFWNLQNVSYSRFQKNEYHEYFYDTKLTQFYLLLQVSMMKSPTSWTSWCKKIAESYWAISTNHGPERCFVMPTKRACMVPSFNGWLLECMRKNGGFTIFQPIAPDNNWRML